MEESLRMSYMIQLLHITRSVQLKDVCGDSYISSESLLTQEESDKIKKELLTVLNIK